MSDLPPNRDESAGGASIAGGASTSMDRWCVELSATESAMTQYALHVAREEAGKPDRLAKILAEAGLAPHKQHKFALPKDAADLLDTCKRLEREGWLLTLRVVSATTGRVVFRLLDSDSSAVEAWLREAHASPTVVTVTPNRLPEFSGTLLVRAGDSVLELVRGPHHWLTKAPPEGVAIERCWFVFPHLSVKYSTPNVALRRALYQHLRVVVRIALGMRLAELVDTRSSVYAEFQWDAQSGYRFFDISYSWVWTGSQ